MKKKTLITATMAMINEIRNTILVGALNLGMLVLPYRKSDLGRMTYRVDRAFDPPSRRRKT
jgi:hypothetical protein